jgi:hypothetical protein
MLHKQAKERRKVNDNGDNKGVIPPNLSPVQAQILINFHGNNMVTVQGPTNAQLFFFMIGQAVASMGRRCKYEEASPIIQVPPGARIKS